MPLPGKRWRHIMINTRCSWLHGDPRGFRDRDHRTHSSGDCQKPPPEHEHQGLRRYYNERSSPAIAIPQGARAPIGEAIVKNLLDQGHRVAAVSVSAQHAHVLVELPDSVTAIKTIIGWSKQKSSRVVSDVLPGELWSAGETYRPVDSASHYERVCSYIVTRQGLRAWTWCSVESIPY